MNIREATANTRRQQTKALMAQLCAQSPNGLVSYDKIISHVMLKWGCSHRTARVEYINPHIHTEEFIVNSENMVKHEQDFVHEIKKVKKEKVEKLI